ncbi:hypothetical protein Bca4012_013254 [Brassica carinata]
MVAIFFSVFCFVLAMSQRLARDDEIDAFLETDEANVWLEATKLMPRSRLMKSTSCSRPMKETSRLKRNRCLAQD